MTLEVILGSVSIANVTSPPPSPYVLRAGVGAQDASATQAERQLGHQLLHWMTGSAHRAESYFADRLFGRSVSVTSALRRSSPR